MILNLVEGEQGLLVLPHPEGSTIFGPGDDFNINVHMGLEGLFVRNKQLGDPGAMTKGYPVFLGRTAIKTKNVQEQGRGTMPALSPAKDLEGLKKSPTVGVKLGRSEMEVMQNFNLKVRERKSNLKLMPQRLQHHDIRTLTLRGRRTNPFLLIWDNKFMV